MSVLVLFEIQIYSLQWHIPKKIKFYFLNNLKAKTN